MDNNAPELKVGGKWEKWLRSDFAFGLYAGVRILILLAGLLIFTEWLWPFIAVRLNDLPFLSTAQGRIFVRFFGGVLFLVSLDRLYFSIIRTLGWDHFNRERRLSTIEKMSGLMSALLGGLFLYFGLVRLVQLYLW